MMRAILSILLVAALAGCVPTVGQTTWSTSGHSGNVTLSAAYDNAQRWAAQCDAQRKGLGLSALGAGVLSLASGVAAGASLTMEDTQQTSVAIGALVGGLLASYLGLRTWYGVQLYSTICMAYEGDPNAGAAE